MLSPSTMFLTPAELSKIEDPTTLTEWVEPDEDEDGYWKPFDNKDWLQALTKPTEVIISPDGIWSSGVPQEAVEFMLMDPRLIEMVKTGAPETDVRDYVHATFPDSDITEYGPCVFDGFLSGLTIVSIKPGKMWRVDEEYGGESIDYFEDHEWILKSTLLT